jgi:Spy/CpxP family protein refolding chaperone
MLRVCLGVIVLALALMGVAYAQEKSDDKAPVKVRGQLPAFFKKLGLRDDQIQKIYKIRAEYKGKVEELKRKLDQLKAAEKAELEKVLTPEQLKRLKELRSGETSPPAKPKEPEKSKPKG